MKIKDQNGIAALVSFLVNKHNATSTPIDHGMQYVSQKGLVCNIFNTGTIQIQSENSDPGLKSEIEALVLMWS